MASPVGRYCSQRFAPMLAPSPHWSGRGFGPRRSSGTLQLSIRCSSLALPPSRSLAVRVGWTLLASPWARGVAPGAATMSRSVHAITRSAGRDITRGELRIGGPFDSTAAPVFSRDPSVCHEHRQFRVAENVAGGAAKDHLAQSALGVGALDQEIAAQRLRVGQNRLARQAAVKTDAQRFCRHAIKLQIATQLLPGWSGHRRAAFDRQYDDAAGTLEDGHRESRDARLLGAAIPRNQNIRAHLRLRRWRCDQDRPAAFEQGRFKRGHARALRIATGFTQDDHIEDPAMAPDEVVALMGIVQPTA